MKLTRRQVLAGAVLSAAAGASGPGSSALGSIALGPRPDRTGGDTLIVLFLRGGADGLNIIVPYGDDDYHRLRPSLGLAAPHDRTADGGARTLDLDGFFGLHPGLAPLLPLYRSGVFLPVHAVGSGDQTRSHFEAMATMERGIAQQAGVASGWIARHLASTVSETESALRAVAIGETMPDSLRGAINATTLTNLADFRLTPPRSLPTGSDGRSFHAAFPSSRTEALMESLHRLYGEEATGGAAHNAAGSAIGGNGQAAAMEQESDTALTAGQETLAALEAIRRLDPANYRPAPGAAYPNSDLGAGFRQAACMIKGEIGLEVACLDMGGWDTHVAQGRDAGWQPRLLADLGKALAAFAADLGPAMGQVTTVVMTEFGRRAYENSGLGTDHGRASCMLLLGGGVRGGRVATDWPGLAQGRLEQPGDLRVTTDYRDILAEILVRRLKNPRIAEVFPDYTARLHNVVR